MPSGKSLVPHKVAQKKPQLAHVVSCSWWRGGGGGGTPLHQLHLPHRRVVAFSVPLYVALKGLCHVRKVAKTKPGNQKQDQKLIIF